MSTDKKTVSVVVPIYNEVSMIGEIYHRVDRVFEKTDKYQYELVFFDDGSTDGTREAIEQLASEHSNVKGVFYARNFGYLKNTFYSVQQAKGDCAIILHSDLQNPPELIPQFIEKWERGAQVVLGVKEKSKENNFMYFLRTLFYYIMIYIFGVKLIPHATEFELFDKSFIEILGKIKTNTPFLRGIIIEYAASTDKVYYTQDRRKKGKSKFNLNKYYDFAICGIVQYSVNIPRKAVIFSGLGMLIMLAEFLFVFLPSVPQAASLLEVSTNLIIRAVLFVLLLLFVLAAFMLEYIIFTVKNIGEKPIVVEERRINY